MQSLQQGILLLGSVPLPSVRSTQPCRESLRDIEAASVPNNPSCMGFRGQVSHNTLAHANEVRDWRTYADFAQVLI
jgi:hypothetical protein